MNLPAFPDITGDILRQIATRHHLGTPTFTLLPETGIFNAVYLVGEELVLRIPRHHPAFVASLAKEAVVVPIARMAGVRTPELVAFDASLEVLPVPYALYERIHGETLGLLELEPEETPQVWQELGHDLALLHTRVASGGPAAGLESESLPDPREWPAELARRGYFTTLEARWLAAWLDRLAPAAGEAVPAALLHGDLQATNVMVTPGSLAFIALLDWGSTSWGDPARDFAGIPLRAVPFLLEGYRRVAPLPHDESAEARILWRHLQIALWLAQREPVPGRAWAERPLGMLLEILRFFLCAPGAAWARWGL